jgi:hypothetical protein
MVAVPSSPIYILKRHLTPPAPGPAERTQHLSCRHLFTYCTASPTKRSPSSTYFFFEAAFEDFATFEPVFVFLPNTIKANDFVLFFNTFLGLKASLAFFSRSSCFIVRICSRGTNPSKVCVRNGGWGLETGLNICWFSFCWLATCFGNVHWESR